MGLSVPHARLYVNPNLWDSDSLRQGIGPLLRNFDQALMQDFKLNFSTQTSVASFGRDFKLDPS